MQKSSSVKNNSHLDDLDRAILNELQHNSSISNVELARRVDLSPPAVHARIKRLEQLGYIRQYVALLDREKMGYEMLCLVQVSLQVHQPEAVEHFRLCVSAMPEVLECFHVTGNYDYVLKVAFRNQKDLQQFLMNKLTPIPGIAHIHTSLVLTEVKSTTILPLDHEE